tara:strand:- start:1136 stop:1714 length:579 start_codon:yes stop_codon:yes gene_type:complete
MDFPDCHITVIDIQSDNKQKQYFYYISGKSDKFELIVSYLKKSKAYKMVKEIERSEDVLLLLVIIDQGSNYVQNVIQKYNGFFIDLHTISGGYEYWHVGVINRSHISKMIDRLEKMGDLEVLHIGEVDFSHVLLSKQQKKVFLHSYKQGYYETPRKTTISKIAKELGLNSATVGEHLMKAENKVIRHSIKTL